MVLMVCACEMRLGETERERGREREAEGGREGTRERERETAAFEEFHRACPICNSVLMRDARLMFQDIIRQ